MIDRPTKNDVYPDTPTTVGPFRILRVLGEGGTGVVYLGERVEPFTQHVAIKMLHPEISFVLGDRLLHHEDRILTSLDHPGIVRLLDRGEHTSGAHYLVMEFIDGLSLLDYGSRNHLSQARRLTLLLEVLQAVDYAHRHLVLHGDLKPENILVTESGHPRLLDFGVAALIGGQRGVGALSPHTPDFASPEQIADGRLTPACDIYALGKIAAAVLAAPAPRSDLHAILQKATQPEPNERYATVRDFANDLQALLDHRPISARPPRRLYLLGRWIRRHRTIAAMAAIIALALAGSVLGVAVQTARAAQQRRIAQSRLHDLVRLTGTLEGELYNSVLPLPQAGPARAALLRAATGSLDALAAQDSGDSALTIEMARQYRSLSSLQPSEAAADRRKALALLSRIPVHDPNHQAAQSLVADLDHR
jgi:serine/threonine protein kinase